MWKFLHVIVLSCTLNFAAAGCYRDPRRILYYYRDCKEVYEKGEGCSGVYKIKLDNLPPFEVYCDMETDGGGWMVFQRRMYGTVEFYREWADYVEGFGDLNGEFWLGLSKIHRLTNSGTTKSLRVDLEDFDGNKRYANYSTFQVLDSSRKYQLNIAGYSGDAGDSLMYQNGMNFTTYDQDNDKANGNCAVRYKGGWWYNTCHTSNLNGKYLSGSTTTYADGVIWYYWKGNYYSLKISEMKLRSDSAL